MKAENLATYIVLATIVILLGIAVIKYEAPQYQQEETTPTITITEAETTESILAGIERYNAEQVRIKEKLMAERYSEETTEAETTTAYQWQPYPINLDEDTQRGIKAVCDRYEIAYNLVIAVAMQESNLNPLAVGDNGRAFGLGQIREEYWSETAAELWLSEWKTDAVQNAEMMCYILARHLNNGATMEATLNIYRHGSTEDYTEPGGETYVAKIKRNLEYLEKFTN